MSDELKPTRLRRLWLRLLATMGIVAAVLFSWWLRVEDARTPDQIAPVKLGQPIDMGRSIATPLSLELHRAPGQEDRLVLTARLENVTGETQIAYFGTPPMPPQLVIGKADLPAPDILLKRDGAVLQQLQPRLPEEVELIWTLPAGTVPTEVEIRFAKQLFKYRDNLYGQSSWLGFAPVASLMAAPLVRT